ncbi:unnamed protein product, partial [Phaeothamnion confervicola]
TGGTPTTALDSLYGMVLSLNGSSYMTAPLMSSICGNTARTISFWVKLASTSTTQRAVFSYGESGTGSKVMITMPGSSKLYEVSDGTNVTTSSSSIDTSWHFIVLRYSGGSSNATNTGSSASGTTTVYLDGALTITSTTVAFIDTGTDTTFMVGQDFGSVFSNFAGNLLDFRAYAKEITSTVITSMYANGPND